MFVEQTWSSILRVGMCDLLLMSLRPSRQCESLACCNENCTKGQKVTIALSRKSWRASFLIHGLSLSYQLEHSIMPYNSPASTLKLVIRQPSSLRKQDPLV